MYCCADCIGDRILARSIIPALSTKNGNCEFCQSNDVPLVEPHSLRDTFELVTSIYVEDEQGKLLAELLKEDWDIFSHENMGIARSNQLLAEILDDREIVKLSFSPSRNCYSDGLERWENLKAELLHENRFFPESEIDFKRLEGLLSHLLVSLEELPQQWYRARIQDTREAFPVDEMGAPPKRKARQGRANPAGIPYLYISSDQVTAISEIRPHTGEIASVVSVSIPDELSFVDLRNARRTVSPFILEDEDEVALLRGDIDFLMQLGRELTRPILPNAAAIDYIPSQYLCEFIKMSGYEGVVYASSVGTGINLALFDPEIATLNEVHVHNVDKVVVEVSLDIA